MRCFSDFKPLYDTSNSLIFQALPHLRHFTCDKPTITCFYIYHSVKIVTTSNKKVCLFWSSFELFVQVFPFLTYFMELQYVLTHGRFCYKMAQFFYHGSNLGKVFWYFFFEIYLASQARCGKQIFMIKTCKKKYK